MTKRAKSRKPIRPGDAWKEMQRCAGLRGRMEDERARHRAKMEDLAYRRAKALQSDALNLTRLDLANIGRKEAEERQRHARAMDRLERQINIKR